MEWVHARLILFLQASATHESLSKKLAELTTPVENMEEGLLASATYDGDLRLAVLKFYDTAANRFWLWRDNTGHRPYCFSKEPRVELDRVLSARRDVVKIVDEQKLDLLEDQKIEVRKIITTDPLAIGGGNDSIRDRIRAWEADIKYFENYVYDERLRMGTYYRVSGGKVLPVTKEMPERVARSLEEILRRNTPEFAAYITEWAELLGQPLCDFKRVAMDIEVANEAGRVPDPEDPKQPVIAVSFYGEQERLVYLLKMGKADKDFKGEPFTAVLFDQESDLLRAVMSKIMDYPVVVTFNGDDFDLRYLKHRADSLGIQDDEDPIQLERVAATLKHGIHVDLYQLFRNKSIQVYAFSNKYSEHTLGGISEALLGKSKIEFEGEVGDLPLDMLARYCFNDSLLTYELTTKTSSVVMKLLLVLARIGKMPVNDVARLGVSNWIRSMLFFEHRKINALIPRQDELAEKGGASSQAIIKGKKYKGGLVIEPKPGAYFDVSVLDFASLYPSLIKVHNLSYETVRCLHEECKKNTVPDTTHWVCTRRKGITSLVIGSLRDLRVSHYKPLAKDASLSKDERDVYGVVTQALKVVLNAAYGVTGFETFALYCLPVAEATAALGRYSITRTIQKCTDLGINVLYSDSVTAERCVTLLDPNDRVRVMPVQQFFDSFLSMKRLDGKDEAHPLGWKALSMNPSTGTVEFRPLKAVIRHRNSKRIFRVREKWGETRVTMDHSLLATTKSGLAFASPLEMQDKHLTRASDIPSLRRIQSIDTWELLKNVEYRTLYKGREKELRASCDDDWVWYGWTNRKKRIRLKRHIIVGTQEFKALVELLGAYVPEGSSSTPDTTKSRMGASIACSDRAWLGRLKECYNLLFDGAHVSIIRSSPGQRILVYPSAAGPVETAYEDMTYKLQMMNKVSAVFFKAFAGQKSNEKMIPDFVYHIPDEYKRLFLENVIKGDGSRVFGKAYSPAYRLKNFKYESRSLRLISGLSLLLSLLRIGHTILYRPSKQTYSIATSTRYNRRRSVPKVTEEPYRGYVYDLSVADYHTFVDGCGGVVLKNTDSLFLEHPSKEQIATVTHWADQELGVELDLDKSYRYVAFSSRKKNYFGVLPDGTVDIKGLTGRKSVHGDTPILARLNGEICFTDVKGAYQKYKEGSCVELLTISDSLTTLWMPISNAFKHRVDEVYRVETGKGRALTLSGDHSVYVMDSFGRLSCKATRDICRGDVLVGARLVPRETNSSNVYAYEWLQDSAKVDRGAIVSSLPHSTTGKPFPAKLPLSPDLGFLLGIFTAEGNSPASPSLRTASISQDLDANPEVCAEIESAWRRTFCWEIRNHTPKSSRRRYYLPVLYAQFFGHLCGGEIADKRVPPILFDAPLEVVAAYLRGVFSGDGWGNGRRVNLLSKSELLISGVAHLLTYFDIDCRVRKFSLPRYGWYFQLSVLGSESRGTFYRKIGFLQPRFGGRVGSAPRNKELIPVRTDGLLKVKSMIERRRKVERFRHINFHDSRFYNLSLLNRYNRTIGQLLEYAESDERALLVSIGTMLNRRDVSYDEVVRVVRVPGECAMYDFSVPVFERFVAGNLPTLLHNSQTPEYLKQTFYKTIDVLSSVKSPEDFERARASIRELLNGMITSIKGKKVPVSDLAFNVMMSKQTEKYGSTTPQHVRAAKQLEDSGEEVKAGEIISFVKTMSPPYVKPAKLARPDEIDAEKYIEYAHSMFDQVLDALDFSFDEIMGATTLDFFWGS